MAPPPLSYPRRHSHAALRRLEPGPAASAVLWAGAGSQVALPSVRWLQAELGREQLRRSSLERAVAHAQAELAEARARLVEATASEQAARQAALHDSLTGLPNRRFFRQHLQQQFDEPGPTLPRLAVLYMDLDRFKPVNDLHGHAAGDEVLKIVAARLAHAVRAEDMMSRLGGDEFACLLINRPCLPQLLEFAVKLLEVVSAPITIERHSVQVRTSVGIALSPGDGGSADAIIRSADRAMLQAKRQGHGVAFFDEWGGRPATAVPSDSVVAVR
jgi:diguanylate cyclase